MKTALKVSLLSIPVALIWYMPHALVPAVDAKNLFVHLLVTIAAVLAAILFFSNVSFRSETMGKLRVFWKNPIGKAMAASYAVLIVSTIFAFDKFTAFLGTASRGEGFVGLSFFYFLTLLLVLVFEKKDWLNFWKMMIGAGTIIFIKEIAEFAGGAYRPGSFMDNPIFLAGYFLCIIYAGIVVFQNAKETKNGFWKWAGIGAVGMSVIGIFITESRGVMVGMLAGAFVALIYVALKRPAAGGNGGTARKFALGFIVLSVLLGGGFIATRRAEVWAHIPGFNRLAQFSFNDPTTRSRIENGLLTLRAVRPTEGNIKNTLVGWGWDNYVFAWEANYDPNLYQYDKGIFDRAHDKLLDVLVMNGVLGLLAYLAIWFCVIRSALFVGRRSIMLAAATLFFGTAFFVQNLFVFDTIISYVPFFSLIAYMAFETRHHYEQA